MLVVRGLNKTYAERSALCDIDLNISTEDGITALLGANGSGKSTLLRVLATATPPDSGWLSFDGLRYAADLRPLRQQLGYLPQTLELPGTLTPLKVLQYLARLKGIYQHDPVIALLETFGLSALANTPISRLSDGQVRMVGIAQAFIGQPRLILLDECLRGLDVYERERVIRMMRAAAGQAIILFSSHIPAEVEQVAQRAVVLKAGAVLFAGEISTFIEQATEHVYEVRSGVEDIPYWLARYIVSHVQQNAKDTVLRVISATAISDGVAVCPSLEDAYLWLCS